jgi:hypothetical protein
MGVERSIDVRGKMKIVIGNARVGVVYLTRKVEELLRITPSANRKGKFRFLNINSIA